LLGKICPSLFPIQQLIFYRFEEGPETLQIVLDHGSKQASHTYFSLETHQNGLKLSVK